MEPYLDIVSILLGSITGISMNFLVGLHPNLLTILKLSPELLISITISYFLGNVLSLTILNVPNEENVLSLNPIQRIISKGKIGEAISLYVISFLFASLIAIPISVLLLDHISSFKVLTNLFFPILLIFILIATMNSKSPILFSLFFVASGFLGIISLNLSSSNITPLLTGLFGLPLLTLNLNKTNIKNNQPFHVNINTSLSILSMIKYVLRNIPLVLYSSLIAVVSSILPALSSSIVAMVFFPFTKMNERKTILTISSISGAFIIYNIVFSLSKLYRAKIGILAATHEVIIQLNLYNIILIILLSFAFSIGIIYFLSLTITKISIDNRFLKHLILIFIVLLVYYVSGVLGLIVLITSNALGRLSYYFEVEKVSLIGCIYLPTLLYYYTYHFSV